MKLRSLLAVVGIAAFAAAGATSASASTQIGSTCSGNAAAVGTAVLVSSAGATPVAASADGVITGWTMTFAPAIPASSQKLKVMAPGPGPTDYTVRADTGFEPVPAGAASVHFSSRLPIKGGDHLGLAGTNSPPTANFAYLCNSQPPATSIGQVAGDAAVGTSTSYGTATGYSLPVVATIEPDVDGDGYGDETQDACTGSAAVHDPCPTIALEAFGAPGKGSASVLVTSDNAAAVTVSGTARIPKPKGGKGKRAKVTIQLTGGSQTVKPGDLAIFKVKYPKDLKQALAGLPAAKSISLSFSASAPNVVGGPTLVTTTAKAPGTGK